MKQGYKFMRKFFPIFLSSILTMGCAVNNEVKIRPLRINVVNSVSKEPIDNLKIYYTLSIFKSKKKILLVLPRPEPTVYQKLLVKEEYITNQSGQISIPVRCLRLKDGEDIYSEKIFINIDIDEARIPSSSIREKGNIKNLEKLIDVYQLFSEWFYNPNPEYNGLYIFSTKWSFDPQWFSGIENSTFDVLWNSEGLLKEEEEFLIELDRI